jgi:DegV family protein with EDD domain
MVRIIVDSSTLWTVEQGKALDIDVVPLAVTINNKTYREYEEINAKEFVEIINQGNVPTSSQPPVGEYIDLFEKYADDEILVICIADGLSGAYQTCLSAAKMTGRDNIEVINSKTLSIPHRLLVEDAIAMRDAESSFKDIVAMCYEKIETSTSFLFPQDFEFLKRGGRLTSMAATLSGLLRIQPVVMQSEDGTRIEKFSVGRNFSIGVNKVLERLEHLGIGKDYRFCVSHNDVAEQAALVVDRIKERFNVERVFVEELSCAFITQGGPHCLAIQVIK